MWDATVEPLPGGRGEQYRVLRDGRPVSYGDVLRLWQNDAAFRSFFTAMLAAAPFPAFRWETPAVTAGTVGRAFEFVLLDEPGLPARADVSAFASHVGQPTPRDGVVAFRNLGRDAVLVVPCPVGPPAAYAHLAAFVRHAPDAQRHALWRVVGREAEARVGPVPVWLSTAGMGVPWLHVRLDDRPKYYGFDPYRAAPAAGAV